MTAITLISLTFSGTKGEYSLLMFLKRSPTFLMTSPVKSNKTVSITRKMTQAVVSLNCSLRNTKKLSRVFIDAKIDRTKRAGWPVLACGQEIVLKTDGDQEEEAIAALGKFLEEKL